MPILSQEDWDKLQAAKKVDDIKVQMRKMTEPYVGTPTATLYLNEDRLTATKELMDHTDDFCKECLVFMAMDRTTIVNLEEIIEEFLGHAEDRIHVMGVFASELSAILREPTQYTMERRMIKETRDAFADGLITLLAFKRMLLKLQEEVQNEAAQ